MEILIDELIDGFFMLLAWGSFISFLFFITTKLPLIHFLEKIL